MPPGICAATTPSGFPFSGGARIAEVTLSALGIERKLNMAGMALARFPYRSDDQLRALPAGDEFSVVWDDAIFVGRDAILGEVTAQMARPHNSGDTRGMVRSLASPLAEPTPEAEGFDFFPAVNENEFFFDFNIPRLGIVMTSNLPIINSATIKEIPPFGSTYELHAPVGYQADRKRSGLLGLVSPKVVIKTCNVRLQVEGGVECALELVLETDTIARFRASLLNVSNADKLDVTLAVWPRPEEEVPGWIRPVPLGRAEVIKEFELPRDIFFRSRWLAVIGAKPFDEDALSAVRFPALS